MTITRRVSRPRQGSILVIVCCFILFVAIIAMATSMQSSQLRSMSSRSHRGFEAVELCDSAINEAASQVKGVHVFDPAVVPDLKKFVQLISDERPNSLRSAFPRLTFRFRPVYEANSQRRIMRPINDPTTGQKVGEEPGEIFVSAEWPADVERTYQVPRTLELGSKLPGADVTVSDVKMRVLCWRRDYVGGKWQNWGVLRYQVRVTIDNGKNIVARTMSVDRMFRLRADDRCLPPGTPQTSANVCLEFGKSDRNLKTVIERQ